MKNKSLTIVHIANIPLTEETGMGRIAFNWCKAAEARGHRFVHIGSAEVPYRYHHILWGKHARQYMTDKDIQPDVILAHEPTAGYFTDLGVPVVLFSHGIEKRGWAIEAQYGYRNTTVKSLFMPDFVRFKSNTEGLRKSAKLLLSNTEDRDFAISNYNRKPQDVVIFKNGYFKIDTQKQSTARHGKPSFLFNASWLERKGIGTMIQAFELVQKSYPDQWRLILAGVGNDIDGIKARFSAELLPNVEIVPKFKQSEEAALYQKADAFILPSFFEGQSLALTQAMAAGLCCIVSDNCGQRDFIQHQHNGLVFKTGNPVDLAVQIRAILQKPTVIDTYGNRARQAVAAYTWEQVSRDVIEVCESVVVGKKERVIMA